MQCLILGAETVICRLAVMQILILLDLQSILTLLQLFHIDLQSTLTLLQLDPKSLVVAILHVFTISQWPNKSMVPGSLNLLLIPDPSLVCF